MMLSTYRPRRRTSLANPSVTLGALGFTKNPFVAKMIGVQNGALIHEAAARLGTAVGHVASVVNFEHYSVEYPTRTSSPSVLMM